MKIINILKKLKDKWNQEFIYIIDMDMFRKYLNDSTLFGLNNGLVLCEEMHIYIGSEKHLLMICNYFASEEKEDSGKGVVFYYDDVSFKSAEEIITEKLYNLPRYFKISLIYCDSVELNEYRETHPELEAFYREM